MPMITLRHYGRSQPTLAVAMIHHDLQQVGIKPLVQEGTQLDLPVKTRNKVTPRIMHG
jgi:hypothetical protein